VFLIAPKFGEEFRPNGDKNIEYNFANNRNPVESGRQIAEYLADTVKKHGPGIIMCENFYIGINQAAMFALPPLRELLPEKEYLVIPRHHDLIGERLGYKNKMNKQGFSDEKIRQTVFTPELPHVLINLFNQDLFINDGKIPPENVHFIPNAVDFERMNKTSEYGGKRIRKKYNIPKEAEILFGAWRPAARKIPEEFIFWLALLRYNSREIHGLISGDFDENGIGSLYGPKLEGFSERNGFNMHFGRGEFDLYNNGTGRNSIVDAFGEADLHIMPSKIENGARPSIEAWATKTGSGTKRNPSLFFEQIGIDECVFYDSLRLPSYTRLGIKEDIPFDSIGCGDKTDDETLFNTLDERLKFIEKVQRDDELQKDIRAKNPILETAEGFLEGKNEDMINSTHDRAKEVFDIKVIEKQFLGLAEQYLQI